MTENRSCLYAGHQAGSVEMSLKAIKTLDYTVILCRDLKAMRTFYHDILGFPITYERHDWVKFEFDHMALALRPRTAPFFDIAREVDRPSVQLAFRVAYDQVDPCYNELSALCIPILSHQQTKPGGIGRCTLLIRKVTFLRFMPTSSLRDESTGVSG